MTMAIEGGEAEAAAAAVGEGYSLPYKIRILNYVSHFMAKFLLRKNGSVNRPLLRFVEYAHATLFPAPSKYRYDVVSSRDYSVDPARNLWFRAYFPSKSRPTTTTTLPLVFYFHGGGFVLFSPNTAEFDHFCRRLAAELPAIVLSVNYRLSPENRFPCQYDDGFDVLRHIDNNNNTCEMEGVDLGRCFLAGDSAGGNLAHHVAVRSSGFGFKKIQILGLISIQPFFGGEERTESEIRMGKNPWLPLSIRTSDFFWKNFLPVGSDRDHPAARVFWDDLTKVEYPPTLIFVGGRDLLRDWQIKYRDWLAGSGVRIRLVEYRDMFHGFYSVPELPHTSMLVDEIAKFIRESTNPDPL